jgi:transposase
MFSLNENNRYQLHLMGVDMRKGIEGLCGIVRSCGLKPENGDVFVFANRTRSLLKLLHWERGGFTIYYKRMELGRLSHKVFDQNMSGFRQLRWDELVLLVEGINLGARRRKRYNFS